VGRGVGGEGAGTGSEHGSDSQARSAGEVNGQSQARGKADEQQVAPERAAQLQTQSPELVGVLLNPVGGATTLAGGSAAHAAHAAPPPQLQQEPVTSDSLGTSRVLLGVAVTLFVVLLGALSELRARRVRTLP
jgi:hypothetical protein